MLLAATLYHAAVEQCRVVKLSDLLNRDFHPWGLMESRASCGAFTSFDAVRDPSAFTDRQVSLAFRGHTQVEYLEKWSSCSVV